MTLAVEGRCDAALDELNDGWTEDWPLPTMYAVDVARVRYLSEDYDGALVALDLAARGAESVDPAVPELASACVRRAPDVWSSALRVALAGGPPAERARAAWRVVRARLTS